jgi:hypothetical protein
MATSFLVRMQNPAWIQGAIGLRVQSRLEWHLRRSARVERMPNGFTVRAVGSVPNFCDRLVDAIRLLEADMQRIEPVNYALLGPVTAGTVDCISSQGVTRAWDAATDADSAGVHG